MVDGLDLSVGRKRTRKLLTVSTSVTHWLMAATASSALGWTTGLSLQVDELGADVVLVVA
jgi:hypothetical protein